MLSTYAISEKPASITFFDHYLIQKLVHDPVIVFDMLSNVVIEVNDVACEIYKIERENFIGSSLKYLWVDNFRESQMFGDLYQKGWVKNFETLHFRSDGFQMNIVVNASIVESEGRKVVVSVNHNITEQVRAEEGIKLARVEWRDTVDAVRDMIIVEDGNGKLRRCNKAASDFFNMPFEKMIGASILSLFSADSKKKDDNSNELVPPSNAVEHLRQKKWEGKFKGYSEWFEIDNHPVNSRFNSDLSWVHIIKDITKRKTAEVELRKFFTVVEQAANEIFITDLMGNIQYLNSMFEESSGKNRDWFFGKPIFEAKPNISKSLFEKEILPVLEKNNFWRKIDKLKRDNEEVFEEITVSKVKDNNEKVFSYVFVCRDVTETRQLESIAEAVNMMDNVGYIFSGIRHELGNPINSVKMALTVLEKNVEKWNKEQINVYVNRSLSEISRVEYLLRALKSFSLHENPKMEKVSLEDFMQNFISYVKSDFEKRGVEISLQSKTGLRECLCDSRALHQIMLNLLTNSADALADNPAPKIFISLSFVKNRVQVAVIDNGNGMNEKQLVNLFKPFYTSKEDGTGLGLVIVQKMLIRMNGTIAVESKSGIGTQVKFTLEAATDND